MESCPFLGGLNKYPALSVSSLACDYNAQCCGTWSSECDSCRHLYHAAVTTLKGPPSSDPLVPPKTPRRFLSATPSKLCVILPQPHMVLGDSTQAVQDELKGYLPSSVQLWEAAIHAGVRLFLWCSCFGVNHAPGTPHSGNPF